MLALNESVYFELQGNKSDTKQFTSKDDLELDCDKMNWKEFINESEGCKFIDSNISNKEPNSLYKQNRFSAISTLERERPNPFYSQDMYKNEADFLNDFNIIPMQTRPILSTLKEIEHKNAIPTITEMETNIDSEYSFEANRRMKRLSAISTISCPENSRVIQSPTSKLSRSSSFASSKNIITANSSNIALIDPNFNLSPTIIDDKNNSTRFKFLIKKNLFKPIIKSFQKDYNTSRLNKQKHNKFIKQREMVEELSMMQLAIVKDKNQRVKFSDQRYGSETLNSFKSVPYLKSNSIDFK